MLLPLPLVTIAIPTYNRADNYLRQTLSCALNQTYRNIEVIVSDNCSIDQTEKLVESFSDPRISYFKHAKNIGANENFNFCLAQAKGIYFLLLHDDDLIDYDFIETCISAVKRPNESGIIRTGSRVIDSNEKILSERHNIVEGALASDFFLSWFRGKTSLYLCSTLFHTEKLRSVGGFNSKYNLLQDGKATIQLAAMFGRIEIPDVKASFRIHELKLTLKTKVVDWCNESLDLLDLMCNLVSENKALIYREGFRFFARLNYRRAKAVVSPLNRTMCYLIVFQKFRYRYIPPPFYNLLKSPYRFCRLLARGLYTTRPL